MRRTSLYVVMLALAMALVPSVASAATWSALTPLNPAGFQSAQLAGIACTSSTNCLTAGRWDNGSGTAALIENWRSTNTWSALTVATPPAGATNSGLVGISCTSSTACTAVGDYTDAVFDQWALVERYNGTTWSLQTFPRPAGAIATNLTGVSCTSSTLCVAVGSYLDASSVSQPLSATWNGTTWTLKTVPIVASSIGTSLSGISCTSSTHCSAVGSYLDARGTPLPTAVGWNGTSWSLQTMVTPTGASSTFTSGISCTSSTACTAVGYATSSGGSVFAFAERWNGTAWSQQALATAPAGSTGTALLGVACSSSTHCSAVGYYLDGSGEQTTLVEGWNGTTWSIQSSPNPGTSDGAQVAAIACTSSTACVSAGSYLDNVSGFQQTLSQRFL